jgi:phosphopantothenoylcysteine synthetase/decarboxylase
MRPVLITTGATRNYLDAIRFISNAGTGQTGLWFAEQLVPYTFVQLFHGLSVQPLPPEHFQLKRNSFTSTEDLATQIFRWIQAHPQALILHSAAVGDFRVESINGKTDVDFSQTKLDSSQALTVRFVPTLKIVDELKRRAPDLFLVSFKQLPPQTSTSSATQIGEQQRLRTQSDIVFTNVTDHLEDCQILEQGQVTLFQNRQNALEALLQKVLVALKKD